MDSTLLLLLGLGVAVVLTFILLVIVYRLYQKISSPGPAQDAGQLLLLQNQIQELNKVIEQRLHDTNASLQNTQQHIFKTMQDQFGQNTQLISNITGNSAKMIADITEKLTSLDKTNQQVIGFSQQLANFEKVLKHQKQRGSLGEAGLKMVLENILPPSAFALQHRFADGDIVDAAIFTKEGIICVDAKFSLDNYERLIHEEDETQRAALENEFKKDLKKRIDETAKYIKPKEGTLEFAFMFIPAEAIYYDLLVNEVGAVKVNTRSLVEYAFIEKRVVITSPTTFSAYLHTVLQGLQALKIEEGAKSIRKNVEALQKHLVAYEDYMRKLGSSMSTSVNHYNNACKEFTKIDKDIIKITDGEAGLPLQTLEKPQIEAE